MRAHEFITELARMDALMDFSDDYIKSDMYVALTNSPKILEKVYEQDIGRKPRGVWFGVGDSWIDWISSEMPHWAKQYVVSLEIDISNMYVIKDDQSLNVFEQKYGLKTNSAPGKEFGFTEDYIKWDEVAVNYDGILNLDAFSLDHTHWTNMWDIPSGCIWGIHAIKNYDVIGSYDKQTGTYIFSC